MRNDDVLLYNKKKVFCNMKYWYPIVVFFVFTACKNNEQNAGAKDDGKVALVNELTEKVKQNPDSAVLRMRLVNSLDSVGQYAIALHHVDSLLMKDSLNQGLWVTKAHLQESNNDTSNAITSYEKAIRIYPSLEAQLYLANLYAETRNQRALIICDNVLAMAQGRETDANCNFIKGVYFARVGNAAKALEAFDKTIIENYTLIEAYLEKGFLYFDRKEFEKSLTIFETAQKVNSRNPDVYYWLAKTHEQMGHKNEALDNYKLALSLDKNLVEAKEGIERLTKN